MKFVEKISSLFSIQELQETVKRFPLSAICGLTLFMIGFLAIFDFLDVGDQFIGKMVVAGIVGFFWCGVVQLSSESHKFSSVKKYLISALGLVFFVLLIFWQKEDLGTRLFSIIISLTVLVSAAPFLLKEYDDLSFWSFNRKVGFGALISFIAAAILFAGASAALASIDYLFDVKIPHEFYSLLWLTGATLVAPLYALSFVPREFQETPKGCDLPPQVGFIANWILAPLVAVYLAILYAYFIKIGVTWDVPKGQLSYMIIGFAIAGIATYQIAWPFIYDGKANKLLETLMRYLFPLLIIPVLVMIAAIGIRIHEYGVTEKRYIVIVSALWFAYLTVGFTLKRLQLKHVMISLALLLFFASWGPWGMTPVSQYSQFNRLKSALTKHEILQEGEIIKTDKKLSFDDRKNISSKLEYLKNTEYYDDVLGWFSDEQIKSVKNSANQNKTTYPANLTPLMGFDFVHRYEATNNTERFHLNGDGTNRNIIAVRGYDYVASNLHTYVQRGDKMREITVNKGDSKVPDIKYSMNSDGVITINISGRGDLKFDLAKLAQEKREQNSKSLILEQFGRGMKIRLVFGYISGKIEDNAYQVENASFTMLLDL